MQLTLFEDFKDQDKTDINIDGLFIFNDFISPEEEKSLIINSNSGNWENTLKRKVQHFGYRYDYSGKGLLKKAPGFPPWLSDLGRKISSRLSSFFSSPEFKQVIINHYLPGQGIGAHVDRTEHFGEALAVLSLGSDTGYRFVLPDYSSLGDPADGGPLSGRSDLALEAFRSFPVKEEVKFILPSRSLVLMSGPSRFLWMHEMPARKSDIVQGVRVPRLERYSITFRELLY